MNGPDLDDDDVLDDALRGLGTPAAGRPAASAASILAAAGASPAPLGAAAAAAAAGAATATTVGSGATVSLGVLGAAVCAALGAGTLLGFGAATALFVVGATSPPAEPVGPASVPAQPTVGQASPSTEPVGQAEHVGPASPSAHPAETVERAQAPVGPASPPAQPIGGQSSASLSAHGRTSPAIAEGWADPVDRAGTEARLTIPAGTEARPTPGADGDAGPTGDAVASAPVLEAEDEKLPRPEARETPSAVGVHHDPMRTLAVGLRVTSGGRAWDGTIDGVSPEIAGAVGFVAGGGSVRPRLRGDLAFGRVDARATAGASGLVGFAADAGPARLDFGAAGGMRWIAAKPGATDAYDDEAGWIVLGAGPSATLVVPRRGGDVFLGGEVLYSWLALDGAVARVPWFGVTAGIEFDPRD